MPKAKVSEEGRIRAYFANESWEKVELMFNLVSDIVRERRPLKVTKSKRAPKSAKGVIAGIGGSAAPLQGVAAAQEVCRSVRGEGND